MNEEDYAFDRLVAYDDPKHRRLFQSRHSRQSLLWVNRYRRNGDWGSQRSAKTFARPQAAPMRLLTIAKEAVSIFTKSEASLRGAAIAFYVVTSLAPILLIITAIAAFVFGRHAASAAVVDQFNALLGNEGGELIHKAVETPGDQSQSAIATVIGFVVLVATASGVFIELEAALNAIWSVKKKGGLQHITRARAVSIGLVIALAFLLIISLAVDAGLKSASMALDAVVSGGKGALVLSTTASFCILSVIFAAIMKYLPAKAIAWKEVIGGAALAAFLVEVGKFMIGWYVAKNAGISAMGAAGALLALLFWVYYTGQIFLFGASVTRAYASLRRHD
jgi:membrane protein